jgi:hypothetical protein
MTGYSELRNDADEMKYIGSHAHDPSSRGRPGLGQSILRAFDKLDDRQESAFYASEK